MRRPREEELLPTTSQGSWSEPARLAESALLIHQTMYGIFCEERLFYVRLFLNDAKKGQQHHISSSV
jgi:hypothetical protein